VARRLQNLNDAINELEALLMKLRPLAMAALANPKDKKALKALTDELDRIASTSDKSTRVSTPLRSSIA
jgi:flagellin-like hook-associated protein FlgL